MEKCNMVQEGRTPCRVCEGGHSEYVCPRCRVSGEKQATTQSALDPEKLSEEHHEH
jgi:hypothetical protein